MEPISSRNMVPLLAISNLPIFWLMAPVNEPLFMAEKFAFDEVDGKRRAVHFNKGLFGPEAVVVDGTGHQLLSRSAFPPDKNRGVAFRDMGDHLVNVPHLVAVADDIGKAVLVFSSF